MSQLPYSESGQGYRRRLPGIRTNRAGGFSKMVTIDDEITVTRDSTLFVGRDKTSGKLVMVDGDNTDNRIMGYMATGKFESDKIAKQPFEIDFDQFNLKPGQEYPVWNNPGMEFVIQIDGADNAARDAKAATLKVGQLFDLFVDTDGTQKMDSSKAGVQLMFLGALGGGFVAVSIDAKSASV